MSLISRYEIYHQLSEEEKLNTINIIVKYIKGYIILLCRSIANCSKDDFLQDINYIIIKVLTSKNKKSFDNEEQFISYIKVCIKNLHSKYLKNKFINDKFIIPYDDEINYIHLQNSFYEYDLIKLIKEILNILNKEEITLLKVFIKDNNFISQCEVAKKLNTSQQCISYKLNKIKKKLSYLLKKE